MTEVDKKMKFRLEWMKQVTHRVHKHPAWVFETERLPEPLRVAGHVLGSIFARPLQFRPAEFYELTRTYSSYRSSSQTGTPSAEMIPAVRSKEVF